MKTLHVNLSNFAGAQINDVAANSYAVFYGKVLYANEDGVFAFEEDGEYETEASFTLPPTDMGYHGVKSLRSILVSGEIDDNVTIDVSADGGTVRELSVVGSGAFAKAAGRSDLRGHYFTFTFKNKEGRPFLVDSADVVFIPAPSRRR